MSGIFQPFLVRDYECLFVWFPIVFPLDLRERESISKRYSSQFLAREDVKDIECLLPTFFLPLLLISESCLIIPTTSGLCTTGHRKFQYLLRSELS